jgi:hypothetical protein
VSSICDPGDLGNFPLHFIYYYITHDPVTTGESYSVKIPGMELVYAALQTVKGDINGDKEITLADVNRLIDMVLSGEHLQVCDVNEDGEVDVADVNALINIILSR